MAKVITKCPSTGNDVATGHQMTQAQFDNAAVRYAFRCTECGDVHQWVKAEAWMRQGRLPHH